MAALLRKAVLLCSIIESVTATAETPKVVKMQMSRKNRSTLQKRGPFTVGFDYDTTFGLYYVNASVGTPPQIVQLQIDTGSSDVWMFGKGSCNNQTSTCLGGSCKPIFQFEEVILNGLSKR